PNAVNFMLREARGMLFVAVDEATAERLKLHPQSSHNTTQRGTAYTVSVDAAQKFGITTGVSAFERATTIRKLGDPASRIEDFDPQPHLALCKGGVGDLDSDGKPIIHQEPVLVRVHSECLTGDVFGSGKCDCGGQLATAMQMIERAGKGVLVYLRQEGRGIGLANKLHAYALQEKGLDTVEANLRLGLPVDKRDYGIGSQILRDLGWTKIRIMTNNPRKIYGIEGYGLSIVDAVPIRAEPGEHNRKYLQVKKAKLGHKL